MFVLWRVTQTGHEIDHEVGVVAIFSFRPESSFCREVKMRVKSFPIKLIWTKYVYWYWLCLCPNLAPSQLLSSPSLNRHRGGPAAAGMVWNTVSVRVQASMLVVRKKQLRTQNLTRLWINLGGEVLRWVPWTQPTRFGPMRSRSHKLYVY